MVHALLTAVEPIFVSAAVAALTAITGIVGDGLIKFITAKKAAVIQKIGVDKYNSDLAVARNIWGIVDEKFRITPTLTKTAESAAAMFEQEILKKIPSLTPDEIDHLRQTVAGEVNKGRTALAGTAVQ